MVAVQRYLQKTSVNTSNSPLPLLNSMFVERFSLFNPYSADNTYKTYIKWARRSPEVIGFISIIATDMLSDRIDFVTPKGQSGRNRIMKAERFWRANKGMEVAEETIYDMLLNGIGYNWLGKLSPGELKEHCRAVARELYGALETKELEYKSEQLAMNIKIDKKSLLAKKLRHIAASTVSMHSDEYEVKKYIQRVGTNTKLFDKDEVITFKLMPLDGKVWPYPPMEAILSQVYLLWLITQNYVSYFENGGHPDKVFILPKELAGSKNHAYLINTLKKYKKIQNKHGNLVFTGDITVEDLQKVENQMENKDLGLYLVGVLAMMYGVPVSRIPFLVGKAAAGGDAGGLADSGYWRKISVWQSKLEEAYNSALWEPFFGVRMKFRRGYLQDEVRETQNEMQRTSVAQQRIELGLWTTERAGEYLGISPEEVAAGQKEKEQRKEYEIKNSRFMQDHENNGNVIPNQDNRLKRKQKQETQLANQQSAGGKNINP